MACQSQCPSRSWATAQVEEEEEEEEGLFKADAVNEEEEQEEEGLFEANTMNEEDPKRFRVRCTRRVLPGRRLHYPPATPPPVCCHPATVHCRVAPSRKRFGLPRFASRLGLRERAYLSVISTGMRQRAEKTPPGTDRTHAPPRAPRACFDHCFLLTQPSLSCGRHCGFRSMRSK